MANSKQRRKNRLTALNLTLRNRRCPECGAQGDTCWITAPGFTSLLSLRLGSKGFWTCAKFYGPDGRRDPGIMPNLKFHPDLLKEEHDARTDQAGN